MAVISGNCRNCCWKWKKSKYLTKKNIMKTLLVSLLLLLSCMCHAQSDETSAIGKIMADQAAAWNRGSIDDFMKGYWQNDSLLFIGKSGITYGYTNALNNYKKNYDNADKMGQLFFTLYKIDKLSPEYCFVIGKWLLKRKAGDVSGIYTLVFRKINGHWLIVSDHSS